MSNSRGLGGRVSEDGIRGRERRGRTREEKGAARDGYTSTYMYSHLKTKYHLGELS